MKINFNNPAILEGYLEQALPHFGFDSVVEKNRFVVGINGGLAWLLFDEDPLDYPRIRISTQSDIQKVKDYYKELESYLDNVLLCKHNFKSLSVNRNNREIKTPFGQTDPIIYAGIGDTLIESAEKFQEFLELIKGKKGKFEELYQAVKDTIPKP